MKKNWGSFGVVFRLILGIILGRGSFRLEYKSESSTGSHRGIGCGIQINSRDVVASSPSFSLPAARAPQRACLQATLNLAYSRLRDVCLFLSRFSTISEPGTGYLEFEAVMRRGKNTSSHRTRPFRSRQL